VASSEGYADQAILELLAAAGPLPATAIAADLAIPARTVRHRLMRLGARGSVLRAADGRYSVATTTIATIPPSSAPAGVAIDAPAVAIEIESPATGRPQSIVTTVGGLAIACVAVAIAVLTRREPELPRALDATRGRPFDGLWGD
jgi:hypothetical protein